MPSAGWWIKIDDPQSLAALQSLAPTITGLTQDLQVLTASSIDGDDRALTTVTAEVDRQQVLDDGLGSAARRAGRADYMRLPALLTLI